MKLTSVWDDLIFVSLGASHFCWLWIWQTNSAFSLSIVFIFVKHHICSPPTTSLQTFYWRFAFSSVFPHKLLCLLDNFFSSVLSLTCVLLEMHRTPHSLPTSLEYWNLHLVTKWCALSCHQCPSWWDPVLCCLPWLALLSKQMSTESCQKCLQDFYWMLCCVGMV